MPVRNLRCLFGETAANRRRPLEAGDGLLLLLDLLALRVDRLRHGDQLVLHRAQLRLNIVLRMERTLRQTHADKSPASHPNGRTACTS